jgi:hypothetical protein
MPLRLCEAQRWRAFLALTAKYIVEYIGIDTKIAI